MPEETKSIWQLRARVIAGYRQLLLEIHKYILETGSSPTKAFLARQTGLHRQTTIDKVNLLISEGMVNCIKWKPRTLRLTEVGYKAIDRYLPDGREGVKTFEEQFSDYEDKEALYIANQRPRIKKQLKQLADDAMVDVMRAEFADAEVDEEGMIIDDD